ncbi:MAG: TrkH family potassium uptake protein [Nitrospirota bacterium]|jgi:trk system potassium uptake protein TrkH
MNLPLILNFIGSVLLILSLFLVVPVAISSLGAQPGIQALLVTFGLCLLGGALLYVLTRKHRKESLRHRDVFAVVTLSWLVASLLGSLPYVLSGDLPSFTDAYFEAMAGFTTTGATVVTDIEGMPRGILFWRHLTQWIGGMGIILFALAVLPLVGSGAMQLFKAEVPEVTVDKLRPRIIDTAKALWYIYAALTGLAVLLYAAGGMDLYDAFCHAFTTLATGGFSTRNASLASYRSPFIDVVATLFMFMAGVNYTLYFRGFRGELSRFWRSSEFRFYVTVTLVAIVLVTLKIAGSEYENIITSVRYAAFQVVSVMTTTGYTTADYGLWPPFVQALLVLLMFFGSMVGSTGGGMKQVRVLLMLKQGYRELYQLIHPHAVTTMKLDRRFVPKEVLGSIWGFLFLFLTIYALAILAMTALGLDLVTSASTVVSAMSNVGPALGAAGPAENYAGLPAAGKWVLIFCMLAGRLEVYTVIVLFVPRFWKK